MIVFAAAIWLRYSKPNVERSYTIPGGKIGIWIVAGIGFLGTLFAISIGFLPPSQIKTGSPVFYEAFMIGGVVIMCAIPLIIMRFRGPHWKSDSSRKILKEWSE